MSLAAEKAQIRRQVRAKRKAVLASGDHGWRSAQVCVHLTDFCRDRPEEIVAGYHASGSEVSLKTFQHPHMALPHINAHDVMTFRLWRLGEALVKGPYGLLQPLPEAQVIKPNIVITPLVAFDRVGGRLGQGGGYYDRALAGLDDVTVIGAAFACQEVPRVPVESHDATLEAVATEDGLVYAPRD